MLNQPDTSASKTCGPHWCWDMWSTRKPNWSTKMSFQPPRKTGEIWPTKKNTYMVSSWQNSSMWVCLTILGGKEKHLFLTQTSAKNIKKQPKKKSATKLLRSWRRTIVLRWFFHALGDDSRRAPRCFCTWAACRTTGGLERSWDSWDERGCVTGGH